MKFFGRPLVALAGILFLQVMAGADELDDRLKAFRESVAPHIAKLTPPPEADAKTDTETRMRMQVAAMLRAISNFGSNSEEMEMPFFVRHLDELRQFPSLTAELRALMDGLAADLPKLAEQRSERRLAEIDRLVKSAGPACLAAKTEAELDPPLRELSRVARGSRDGSSGTGLEQRASRRLQSAIQAVSTWQDYLAFLALGHVKGANAALKRLAETSDYPVIALAEIEKRLAPEGKSQEPSEDRLALIARTTRIEDLDAALAAIRNKKSADHSGNEDTTFILGAFEELAANYASLQAGLSADAFRYVAAADGRGGRVLPLQWAAQLTRLRALFLLKVLPRYLDLRDIPPPKPEENGRDYLLRLAQELVEKRRFADVIRVLEIYRAVAFGVTGEQPAWISADVEGLKSYAAAERFAEAGMWPDAINGFRRAAQATGRFNPAQEAAKRMAELTLAHPEEAKAAVPLAEAEAAYQRSSRDALIRGIESRMPSEIRNRMLRTPGGSQP